MIKTTLRDEIGDFTAIPNDFIEDKKQIPESRILFMYLRYHTNRKKKRAFPGYDLLIKETGLSRQKVAKGLKILETTGWMVKHKLFAQKTEYELRYPVRLSSTMEQREEAALVPLWNASSSIVEQPPLSTENKTDLNQTEETATPSLKPQKSTPYPARKDWPKHVAIYFAVTNRAPAQPVWPLIAQRMGPEPNIERLRECYVAWMDRGFKEFNNGWLDWYTNGIPERKGGQRQALARKEEDLDYLKGANE